jgi:RNA polymerase sigma factor (sigma-70 family)
VTVKPFEQIVDEHGPTVLRVCRAMLEPADADDAWSETFLAALRAYPQLRPGSNVRAWLVTIAHRKAIDRHRVIARGPVPAATVPERPARSNYGIPAEPDAALRDALRALPPKQRGAVAYHYLADLPYQQVGKLLGTSEAAARRSAADGIAALRQTYQPGTYQPASRQPHHSRKPEEQETAP